MFLLLCKECRRAERGSSREDETKTHSVLQHNVDLERFHETADKMLVNSSH